MIPARAWHSVTALVALAAVLLQLVLVVQGSAILVEHDPPNLAERVLRFFAYFTIESNLLVLVTAAQLARDPGRDGDGWRVLRTMAVSGITVTGLVHWFLLRPLLDLHGADALADTLLHVVVPALAVAGWLVVGPRPRVTWATSLRAALWPLGWLAAILLQGSLTGWFPYPFLDHDAKGWGHVLVVCAGILALFLAVYAAMRGYDRRVRPAPARSRVLAER